MSLCCKNILSIRTEFLYYTHHMPLTKQGTNTWLVFGQPILLRGGHFFHYPDRNLYACWEHSDFLQKTAIRRAQMCSWIKRYEEAPKSENELQVTVQGCRTKIVTRSKVKSVLLLKLFGLQFWKPTVLAATVFTFPFNSSVAWMSGTCIL